MVLQDEHSLTPKKNQFSLSLSLDLGNGQLLEIRIRTSPRARRLRLVSSIEGVRAVVPQDFSSAELSEFVQSKQQWLRRTATHYQRLREKCDGFDQYSLLYLGACYRAIAVSDNSFAAVVSDALKTITFHIPDRRRVRAYQEEWFKQETRSIIRKRLPALAEKMGLRYNKVTIKKQKSRWGSCSKKGNLNFNLMLAAAPPNVIDYVIIHELAHLAVLDHSSRFWMLVQGMDPNYAVHREWLNNFAPLIKIG